LVLPGIADCCWTATASQTSYPSLKKSARTDVAVVGAGIVGLTVAYALVRAGLKVTVLEARQVGRQVTGRSTAKVTSQHALIYRHLRSTFDLETARLYAEANRAGVRQIRTWVHELAIACDLEQKDAYTYTCDKSLVADIENEAEVARKLGFKAEVISKAPLPFETAGALRFANEGQFNPTRYLVGLGGVIAAMGGTIFENTRVTKVAFDQCWQLTAESGRLDADHIVLATNLPTAGPGNYDIRTRPRGHIAMAFRMESEKALDGMFIGIDQPTHSLRMGCDQEGALLVVLGPAFVTGQDGDIAARFRELERWARDNLPVGEAAWRWVNEDYDTADRVPYVGQPSRKSQRLYIATGFNGWGISNGTAAGLLISDQIQGRSNPWSKLYDPRRRGPRNYNKGGETQSYVRRIDDIPRGHGGVVRSGKDKLAVWKSASGRLHTLSASCTHAGCTVTWNNADLTWDCPCHGSMFSPQGKVIHGPAVEPLAAKKTPQKAARGGNMAHAGRRRYVGRPPASSE
jgi:glycine/D-amino acid oxidase-like deaminating enzyme/nitrite reductase/ring-hydroxylating ferredoxin subunit